jgi:Niemann-Pick C1 protein
VVLIILYSFLVFGRCQPLRSRTALAASGVISIGFAYIEAIGLGTYFGLEVSGITDILPFVLLGIGVDDMYVLVLTLDQSKNDDSVEIRITHMMKHAGTSITITSLTSLFSFAMGATTSLPAL